MARHLMKPLPEKIRHTRSQKKMQNGGIRRRAETLDKDEKSEMMNIINR